MEFERDRLVFRGRSVDVDATRLPVRGSRHGKETKPRLRFDKVVVRVTERLRAAAGDAAPSGVTVLLSLTAPIKVPAKTAAMIEERMRAVLARRPTAACARYTILGNYVRVQVVTHGIPNAPKLISFVHDPETNPRLLFDMTQEALDLAKATAQRRPGAHVLVVKCARSSACLETYRHIWTLLSPVTTTLQALMVFHGGRAESLTT
jgi:hypothetical protein